MSDNNKGNSAELIDMTAEIVSAYVSHNDLPREEIPAFIQMIHEALHSVANGDAGSSASLYRPAVPIKNSVTPDHIICLEDGKKFKSLKRHLRTQYGMTPEEYREKWRLPKDYPMVAPNYAEARSRLAKEMGLGQARKGRNNK